MEASCEGIIFEESHPNNVNIKSLLVFDLQDDKNDEDPFILRDFVYDKGRPPTIFILSVLNYIH